MSSDGANSGPLSRSDVARAEQLRREEGNQRLEEVVAAAQVRGFVGDAAAAEHVRIGMSFAEAAMALGAANGADLGSGGGVPGLMVASHVPGRMLLVESTRARAQFLAAVAEDLGLADVVVECARAEELGRSDEYRGAFNVVTARGFGPAATTAECGAPLLARGGHLIVSEPPDSDGSRWPASGLIELGLELVDVRAGRPALAVMRSIDRCDERFPRRVGIPRKRPLFV